MSNKITDALIASYATKGNAHRIRVIKEENGTYGYAEFHRLKIVGRGSNYPTLAAVEKVVDDLIVACRELDGIDYRPHNGFASDIRADITQARGE